MHIGAESILVHAQRMHKKVAGRATFPDWVLALKDEEELFAAARDPMGKLYAELPIAYIAKMLPFDFQYLCSYVKVSKDSASRESKDFVRHARVVFNAFGELLGNISLTGLSDATTILIATLRARISEAKSFSDYHKLWTTTLCPTANPTCRELLRVFVTKGLANADFKHSLGRILIYRPLFFWDVFGADSATKRTMELAKLMVRLLGFPMAMLLCAIDNSEREEGSEDLVTVDNAIADGCKITGIEEAPVRKIVAALTEKLRRVALVKEKPSAEQTEEAQPYAALTEMLQKSWNEVEDSDEELVDVDDEETSASIFEQLGGFASIYEELQSDGTIDMRRVNAYLTHLRSTKGIQIVREFVAMLAGRTESKFMGKLLPRYCVRAFLEDDKVRDELFTTIHRRATASLPELQRLITEKFPFAANIVESIAAKLSGAPGDLELSVRRTNAKQ